MTIGNVLLRPQLLERSTTSEGYRIVDILLELSNRLLQDALAEGTAQQKISIGVDSAILELKNELEQRLEQSATKLLDWFQPFQDTITNSLPFTEESSSLHDVIEGVKRLIQSLTQTLDETTAVQLSVKLNSLFDIVENDLGLSRNRITDLITDAVDRIIDELTNPYLGGIDTTESKNHFLIGSQISRLKNFALNETQGLIPSISSEDLVNDIIAFLNGRRWDEINGKLKAWLEKMLQALDAFARLTAPSVDADVSVNRFITRAPGDKIQMSWYASWFRNDAFLEDYTQVGDRLKLEEEPIASNIGFSNGLDAAFMEHWAHITAGATDLSEAILHILSQEKGDRATNFLNAAFQLFKGLFVLISHDHDGEDWPGAYKLINILEYWVSFAGTTLSSLESYPGSGSAWFLSNWLPDQGEMLLYGIWTNQFREFWLSLFTLINERASDKANIENYQKAWGFSLLFMEVALWGSAYMPKAMDGDKHYGIPFGSDSDSIKKLVGYWFIGIGFGFGGSLIGWLLAAAISGKFSTDYWTKDSWYVLKILGWGIIKWPVYWFLVWDGDTKDGTLGLDASANVVTFPGYPSHTESPYKLPYPKGVTHQCVQGNHGLWSHNTKTEQTYAYDFSHDEGDEVLAMRAGTVEHFSDRIPNNNTDDWNVIVIKHDDNSDGPAPNPDHDRNHTGTVMTRAEYGHGAHFGIRHAFALRGIPKAFINGARVKQGHLIMLAGDTGRSAYNHLHVHVKTAPAISPFYITIPYVFKEVDHLILGRDGVAKAFDYYESDNEKQDVDIESLAKYQPEYHEGNGYGIDQAYIKLDPYAKDKNDYYNGQHIFLTITNPDGTIYYQYKRISDYDGKEKKAYIDGGWDFEIPLTAALWFQIGAKPYEEANDFNKKFGYLADRDDQDQAIDFVDGHPPYTLQTILRYASDQPTGVIQDGGGIGLNHIILETEGSSSTDQAYTNRHLVIYREGNIIQYRRINSYEGATRKVVIDGVWDLDLLTGAGGDTYEIGAAHYTDASNDEKNAPYLASVSGEDNPAAQNFGDGREPYKYFLFQMNWNS